MKVTSEMIDRLYVLEGRDIVVIVDNGILAHSWMEEEGLVEVRGIRRYRLLLGRKLRDYKRPILAGFLIFIFLHLVTRPEQYPLIYSGVCGFLVCLGLVWQWGESV